MYLQVMYVLLSILLQEILKNDKSHNNHFINITSDRQIDILDNLFLDSSHEVTIQLRIKHNKYLAIDNQQKINIIAVNNKKMQELHSNQLLQNEVLLHEQLNRIADQKQITFEEFDFKKFESNPFVDTKPEFQEMCKNHQKKPACYYTKQEPWIKFCSKCALNLVLCGKKIQKRLSDQQLRKKYELQRINYQLKFNLKITNEKEGTLKQKIDFLENQYKVHFDSILEFYDHNIEVWTKMRQEINKSYQMEFLPFYNQMKNFQSKLEASASSFRIQMDNIQTNFPNIIHELSYEDFKLSLSTYKNNIDLINAELKCNDPEFQFNNKKNFFEELFKNVNVKQQEFKLNRLENLSQILNLHQNVTSNTCNPLRNTLHLQNIENKSTDATTTLQEKTQVSKRTTMHVSVNKQNQERAEHQIKLKLKSLQYSNSKKELKNRTTSKLSDRKQVAKNSKSPITTPKIIDKRILYFQKNM